MCRSNVTHPRGISARLQVQLWKILDLGVAPRSRPKRIACTWSLVNRYTARAGVPRAGSPGRHISARNTPCSRPFPARTKVQNPHARTHARTMNDFICAFVCYKTSRARRARRSLARDTIVAYRADHSVTARDGEQLICCNVVKGATATRQLQRPPMRVQQRCNVRPCSALLWRRAFACRARALRHPWWWDGPILHRHHATRYPGSRVPHGHRSRLQGSIRVGGKVFPHAAWQRQLH